MATQTRTRTQRQASGKKAAATRKRNAAKQSTQRTKASARRTTKSAARTVRTTRSTKSAQRTARAARSTARQTARSASRRTAAETTRLEGVARQAERVALLIPVGVALEARDRLLDTVGTLTNRSATRRQLSRYERRGATALRRNRRGLDRQIRDVRREVGARANGFQASAEDVAGRVRTLA